MGESFLDFTDEGLEKATEPMAVEGGEYTIKLVDWKTDKKGTIIQIDKNGYPYILPIFEVVECEEAEFAKRFSSFIRIPHDDMSKNDKNVAQWDLNAFFTCFGIDYTQRIDCEECLGMTGDVLLIVTPDEGYGEQNKIKRFLNPR